MRKVLLVLAIGALFLLQGCGGGNASPLEGDSIKMRHARNLTMSRLEGGATLVTLRNPWDTTRNLARYVLIDSDDKMPDNLPEGTVTIRVPIERSVVYSGIHVSLIDELGSSGSVNGVCDAEYIGDPATRKAIESGRISDCGKSNAPVMERIVSLRPQIIVLSPFEKSDEVSRFASTGIKVIEAADYMEPTPLGRAEWMRFFGRLYGQAERADSLFEAIETDYLALRDKASAAKTRPAVLFDRLYNGIWNVPTSGSVTGILINDAGGKNPFDMHKKGGFAQLTAEEVLYNAQNADIWLIRYSEPELTLATLGKENPVYSKFKAYKGHTVYGANTLSTRLFDKGAFHPELILREMIRLFHPETEATPLKFYSRLK